MQTYITNPEAVKPWDVMFPVVFRYLDQKHIDDFFNEGKIRLSTFFAFSKHKDEQRFDNREGWSINNTRIRTPNGHEHEMYSVTSFGYDSLILCTSLREDGVLREAFEVDGYFKIKDPTQFAVAIARKFSESFKRGMQGHCLYKERLIVKEIEATIPKNEEHIKSMALQIPGTEPFFLKPIKYNSQCEYRFVWALNYPIEKEFMDIVCPEAVQFCEKIT